MVRALSVLIALSLGIALCSISLFPTEETTVRKATRSAVRFLREGGEPLGSGSFVSTPNGGILLTNAHVCKSGIQPDGKIKYLLLDEITIRDTVITYNSDLDLCAVAINPHLKSIVPALHLGNGPAQFEKVYAIGYPLERSLAPSPGYLVNVVTVPIVMKISLEDSKCDAGERPEVGGFFNMFKLCVKEFTLYETTIITYPGNSGSPVINLDGELVAVINSGDNYTHFGNAVLYKDIKGFLNKL